MIEGFFKLPMTGFEPQISGVEGDHSTNWGTTTALTVIEFTYKVVGRWLGLKFVKFKPNFI